MEAPKNWFEIDPETVEGFKELNEREQNAVRVALNGLYRWRKTGLPPAEMRVVATPERPFYMREFVGVLHNMGIGIEDTLETDGTEAYIFQPFPDDVSKIYGENLNAIREKMLERLRKMSGSG